MSTVVKGKKNKAASAPKGVLELAIEACHDLHYGHLVEGSVRGSRKPVSWFFYASKPYTPGAVILGRLLEEKRRGLYRAEPSKEFADPEALDRQVRSFFRAIPKTEIHLHFEGCIRKETFLEMARRNPKSAIRTAQDVERLFTFHNLGEFIRAFVNLQDAMTELADFERLFEDLAVYLKKNHIVYAEIFFAISKFVQKGFTYPAMLETLSRCIRNLERSEGTRVRLLIDVSRTFGAENAKANLARVLESPNDLVLGIGLGGDEKAGPAGLFKETFRKAVKAGLHVVAHAGEDVGPESVWSALKDLGAERLGHGMAAIEDEKLMADLAKRRTPIELCLTSNVFTGRYTRTLDSHPAQVFHPKGLNLTVNSDDPTFFKTDLSQELWAFHRHLHFSIADILTFVENGALATFHPERKVLWKLMSAEIAKLRRQYPLVIV